MNTKTQQSQFSSINLNQIIDDQEFKQLLNQKVQSFGFSQNFLHDLSKNSFQSVQVIKKKPQCYDSQSLMKQRQMMELAYEKRMRPGKLLSNPIFRFQLAKQNQSSHYAQDDNKDDYFAQYIKWKTEPNKTQLNNRKFTENNYQKTLQTIAFKSDVSNKPKSFRYQSPFDADELNAQIKKIHQQYLQKVTKATSKNLFPQRIDLTQIGPNNESNISQTPDQNLSYPIQVNSSRVVQIQEGKQLNSTRKIVNEVTQTKLYKFEDSDINDYCFENMIRHKPDFIIFKNDKNLKPSSGPENSQKLSKKDIRQEYFFQNNSGKISDRQNNEPSLNSQSRLTDKSLINEQNLQNDPFHDPYYRQLKQMIRSGHNQYSQVINKQIHTKQIPTKQIPKPTPIVRLNIQKLLKLPYKEFILFFDQNHRKIVSMTQPQQYKRLQVCQVKCLEHAESIQKLRERFSSDEGAKLIKCLSVEQKEKLFKVLYEENA